MTNPPKCVFIVAGEASGDLHGANFVRSLRSLDESLFVCGIGGERMRQAGVRILVDAATLSVVGITEVFSRLPEIFHGWRTVKKLLYSLQPDLVVLLDFPDFNFRVAGLAKKLGIPVLYYISPQIWAWRSGRVKKMADIVDHMAVILPFEARFYQTHGIPVTFVGHPLLDAQADHPPQTQTAKPSLSRTIGLLPGSRDSEVKSLLPRMLDAARHIQPRHPGCRFRVSIAPSVNQDLVAKIMENKKRQLDLEVDRGAVSDMLPHCCLAIVASGTVTLEAAISGTPMIIVYRVSGISYWLGRMLIRVPHIGLVNLVAGEELVPELLQKDTEPAILAGKALAMLGDPKGLERTRRDLFKIRKILGSVGASERVAEIAREMLWK